MEQPTTYSIWQAAKKYGMVPSTWYFAVQDGRVPGPTHPTHTPKRFVYTAAEAAEVYRLLTNPQPTGSISVEQAAETMGRSYSSVVRYCRRYDVGTYYGRKKYLTSADMKKLYQYMGVEK